MRRSKSSVRWMRIKGQTPAKMAKSSGNLSSRRSLSHNTKPYDANNSFIKKVANKVTDFIPQPSWISKWFNTSQENGDVSNDTENLEEAELEETEVEEDIEKPPPSKRPRIRTDITHPPGTFSVRSNAKTSNDNSKISKETYSMQNETRDNFLKPSTAGPSGIGHLTCSVPTTQLDNRPVATQRSDLNLLIPTSNNGTANGLDDNSESSESTSGCSSLIPQTNRQEAPSHDTYSPSFVNRKRFIDDKLTFTNHLQSPRTLFVESSSRDTLNSRRPSFNASVMTNTLDRASSMSSPFYNGNTIFGGANAAGLYKQNHSKSLLNSTSDIQLKVPRRTSVQVKPSNATVDPSGMSQTARKILEALEHFSSPISDAKKIPLKSSSNASLLVNKKRPREESEIPSVRVGLRHLTRELTVPTVPEMLKLRRCQKLQDTTVAARKIVSARSGPPPPSQEYRLGSYENENVKYHGKVKAKAKTNLIEEDTIETINLPNVPLPISSLPNFNFTLPQPQSKNVLSKEDNFKFASPIKVTDSTQNFKSVNNFTFSNPINAEDHQMNKSGDSWLLSKPQTSELNSLSNSNTMLLTSNFIWSGSSTAPRPKEKGKHETNSQIGSKVTNDFKASSIVDALCNKSLEKTSSSPKAELMSNVSAKKPACNDSSTISIDKDVNSSAVNKSEDLISNTEPTSTEIWECSECLIRNNVSKPHCIACKTAKPKSNVKVTISLPTSSDTVEIKTPVTDCFGSQFKISNMQWDCTSCSTKNKQTDIKCVSCNAQKAESFIKAVAPVTAISNSDPMSKFKPAEGSWECPGCMLRNGATTIKCPCCSASKPSSLKVSPKKNKSSTIQENVSNQESNADKNVNTTVSNSSQSSNPEIMEKFKPSKNSWECPSCMVRNVDTAVVCPCCNTAKPTAKDNKSTEVQKLPANGFGDKFKKPEGSWSCDTCMVQNQAESLECVSCGSAKPGSVKPKESISSTSSNVKFSFGIPAGANNFKFGIDKADNQSKSGDLSKNNFKFGSTQQTNETGKFVFGIPKEDKSNVSKSAVNTDTPQIVTPKTSECNIGFQFNTKSDKTDTSTNLTESEKKTVPFSFGIPKSENSTLSTEKQLVSTVQSPFTFGVNKIEVNTSEKKKDEKPASENIITEVTASTTNVTNSSFTSKVHDNTSTVATTTQNNILESTSNPTFSFNALKTSAPVSNSTSIAPSTCLPSYSQHSFTFSDVKTVTQTATTPTSIPTFGQIATSSSIATSTVPTTFTFGTSESIGASGPPTKKINAPVATATGTMPITPQIFTSVSKTMPLFSNSDTKTTVAFGTGENTVPTFTTGETKTPLFGTSETKVPVFGSTENKSIFGTTENKMSVFGNTEKSAPVFSTPTTIPTPTFGSRTNNTALFGSTAPVFGNTTTSNFGSGSTPNIFSTTKSSENNVSNPSLFTFGASSNQTTQPSGNGFNFCASNSPAGTTQKPLFTFDNNSTRQQSNILFGGSGFNNTAQSNTSNFTFNAPKPEISSFGQPAVPTPLFSVPQNNQNQSTPSFSSTPASNTEFSFGSTAPATTFLNFERMEPTSTPSGGFNFNAPSSAPAVSFDPNTPPSFNFTGGSGQISFNAPRPTGSRKIKKAVRRMRYPGNDSQR